MFTSKFGVQIKIYLNSSSNCKLEQTKVPANANLKSTSLLHVLLTIIEIVILVILL